MADMTRQQAGILHLLATVHAQVCGLHTSMYDTHPQGFIKQFLRQALWYVVVTHPMATLVLFHKQLASSMPLLPIRAMLFCDSSGYPPQPVPRKEAFSE